MWVIQHFRNSERVCNMLITTVKQANRIGLKNVCFNNRTTFEQRALLRTACASSVVYQKKAEYEYDPNTDSFRPKILTSYTISSNQNNTQNGDKQNHNLGGYLKKFIRNLFLLTGGIVWIGALFVNFFVDVHEEEYDNRIRDFDDEVRLLAFYDVGRFASDLAKMMSKEKSLSDVRDFHSIASRKQVAFVDAVKWLQEQDTITSTLGMPVHLCGFRAAEKIGQMIQSFQQLAEYGIGMKKSFQDNENKNLWNVECILEGPKGVCLAFLHFERSDEESEWVPIKASVMLLEPSKSNIFERNTMLPDSVINS